MSKTCYVCGADAPTMDHLPPKVFFPEKKDLPAGSPDYRMQLLTVPACEAHNAGRSTDDEYAAFAICLFYENNGVALNQFATKVMRALRQSTALTKRLLGVQQAVLVGGRPSRAIALDVEAMSGVFTRIAEGVYFHRTGSRYPGKLIAISPSLRLADLTGTGAAGIDAVLQTMKPSHSGCVGHADVFRYDEFSDPSSPAIRFWRFVFYGGFTVHVFPQLER